MEFTEIKKKLTNGSFCVVFPKAKESEKAAIELADLIENTVAVASFADKENKDKISYGAIVKLVLLDQEEVVDDKM